MGGRRWTALDRGCGGAWREARGGRAPSSLWSFVLSFWVPTLAVPGVTGA